MTSHSVDAAHLLALIERIERYEEEKATISVDIKEVYAEAKGAGYDIAVMRKIVAMRKLEKDERREAEAILGLYMAALGMAA